MVGFRNGYTESATRIRYSAADSGYETILVTPYTRNPAADSGDEAIFDAPYTVPETS